MARYYADNKYNRKIGRVGKRIGTHVISKKGNRRRPKKTRTRTRRVTYEPRTELGRYVPSDLEGVIDNYVDAIQLREPYNPRQIADDMAWIYSLPY